MRCATRNHLPLPVCLRARRALVLVVTRATTAQTKEAGDDAAESKEEGGGGDEAAGGDEAPAEDGDAVEAVEPVEGGGDETAAEDIGEDEGGAPPAPDAPFGGCDGSAGAASSRGGLPYGHGGSGGAEDDDEEEEEEEEKPKKKGKAKKAKKKDDEEEEEDEEEEKPKKGKGKKAKKKNDDGDEEEEEKPKKGKDKKPKKKKEEPKPIRILGRVGGFKSADEAKTLAASMSLAGDERPEALREKWGAEYVLSAKADTPVVEPKVKKEFDAAREAQDKVRPAEVDVVAFAITLAEITNEAAWAKKKAAFTKEFAAALEVDAKQLDELKVDVVDAVPKPKKEKKGKKGKKGGDETPKKGKKAKKDGDGPDEAQLRAKFDEYDTDGSGAIEKEELRALLKATSGVDPSDEEVDEMMAKADDDGDGTMSFEEFVTTYRKVQSGELEFAAFSTMMKDFDSLVNALDDEAKPEDVEVAEAEEEDTTA